MKHNTWCLIEFIWLMVKQLWMDGVSKACRPFKHQLNQMCLSTSAGELNNSTISWEQVFYGDGKSVGSNFLFDEKQHSLKPKNAGTYFMYLNINLTCTSPSCPAGLLTVHLGDELTCEVKIPKDQFRVSHKCWTVSRMDNKTGILAQMTVPKEGLENWKLERRGSNFGMFLVD